MQNLNKTFCNNIQPRVFYANIVDPDQTTLFAIVLFIGTRQKMVKMYSLKW